VDGWFRQLGLSLWPPSCFGVAWLIFASIKGFFDGMTRGLRGDDEP
jgi:hypothetical protein